MAGRFYHDASYYIAVIRHFPERDGGEAVASIDLS